jgi:ATP-dependent DNA ligase
VEQKKRLRLYAFDTMPLSEWTVRSCSKQQTERSYDLGMMLAEVGTEKILFADARTIKSVEEAEDFYNEVIGKGEEGKNEGLIIKDPNGYYEWLGNKRSGTWVKWKPVYSYDLKIIGYNAGRGKFKGLIGSLKCKGKDENGTKIEADASGMDDKMRKWFTDHQQEALGLVVELEAGRKSKAKNSDIWALRFPQFKQIRWDKSKRKPF